MATEVEARQGFVVTKGLHSKGSCVVVRHGDMELWIEANTAARLGRAIVVTAQSLIREDRAIRVRARRRKARGL